MSDELVMMNVASEDLWASNLYESRAGGEGEVRLSDAWKAWQEHPEDYPEVMCFEDFPELSRPLSVI